MLNDGLLSSVKQDWETPQDDFNIWNKQYNFTLDPCCTSDNCKCPDGIYHDLGEDGLALPWSGRVFMNPPYSDQKLWIPKAVAESKRPAVEFVIGLLPSRTDTALFHKYIWDRETCESYPGVGIEFLPGRLKFGSDQYWETVWTTEYIADALGNKKENPLYMEYGKKNSSPFPSMLICWTNKPE